MCHWKEDMVWVGIDIWLWLEWVAVQSWYELGLWTGLEVECDDRGLGKNLV